MGEKEGGERGGYERGEGEGEREGEGSKGKGRERGEREGEWGVGEGEGSKGKGREGGEREGRVGEERDRGRGWSVSSHAVTHSRTHKQAYTLAQTNKQTLSLKHTLAPPPNTHTVSHGIPDSVRDRDAKRINELLCQNAQEKAKEDEEDGVLRVCVAITEIAAASVIAAAATVVVVVVLVRGGVCCPHNTAQELRQQRHLFLVAFVFSEQASAPESRACSVVLFMSQVRLRPLTWFCRPFTPMHVFTHTHAPLLSSPPPLASHEPEITQELRALMRF